MKFISTDIHDVQIIQPTFYGDERGEFYESYNQQRFSELIGLHPIFIQDNHTSSAKGCLHGLHYQIAQPQSKLVRVVSGAIFDVAVDIRKSSPSFGRWTGTTLTAENKLQMWIPSGLAHGFLVLSNTAQILYKVTDYYSPEHERCIAWNDATIGIDWPLFANGIATPTLSSKDQRGESLHSA